MSLPPIATQAISPANKKRALGLIFFVMLMDIMGILLLSPVAPQLVMRYSDKALMVTMLTVIYACGQFIAAPFFGKLGDRYGRRPVLLFSIFGQAVGYLIFGLGGSLWGLFLGRAIGGITAGNLSTASAYIADVSTAEDRTRNFTIIGTSWSLGLILGPTLGGIFGELNLAAPAFVAAGIGFVNVLLGYFLLPESLPLEKRHTAPIRLRDTNPVISIIDMARKPGVAVLMVVYSVFSLAFNGVSSTSTLFLIEKFAAQTWQVSLALMLQGLCTAAVNTFMVTKVIRRHGEKGTGVVSVVITAIVYAGTFFMPFLWFVYPLNMIAGGTNAFFFTIINTLFAEQVALNEVGSLMGVISAVGSLMNVFGPLYAGLVYDHVQTGSPYWIGALGMLLAGFMLSRIKLRQQPASAQLKEAQ